MIRVLLLVLTIGAFAPAWGQVIGLPTRVLNGGSSNYTGTVRFGLPLPDNGTSYPKIDGRLANGTILEAEAIPLTYYPSGNVHWFLACVSGTFPPGETLVYITPSTHNRPQEVTPINADVFAGLELNITSGVFGAAMSAEKVDFSKHTAQAIYKTSVYMLYKQSGALQNGLKWELYSQYRKGEQGIRCELLLHNDSIPDLQAGPKTWYSVKHAEISIPTIGWTSGTTPAPSIQVTRGYNSGNPNTILGKLGIVDGRYMGPISLSQNAVNGRVQCDWFNGNSAIPMGSPGDNQWVPHARPGDPVTDTKQNQLTTEGQAIVGGQKFSIEFFVGDALAQEHLDCPPGLVWANQEDYRIHLMGGGSSQAPQYADPDRARYERIRSSLMEASLCDSFPGHNPNTLWGFISRGGTFGTSDYDNPHFGIRDIGDTTWGDGYAGANHYHMTTHLLNNYLSTADHRFLIQARQRLRHYRTIDWIHATSSPTKFQGKCRYEKGGAHGNAANTGPGHIWSRALAMDYVLTGSPESKSCMDQLRHYLLTYADWQGAPVDPAWVTAGNDPKNWGAASLWPGTTTNNGGSAAWGWQGDWGLRIPARTISMLVDDMFFLGRDNTTEIHALVGQVLRVETGIWGGNGYILNRASRGNGTFDHEQTWMLAYLCRAIGKALTYGADTDPTHQALYTRMLNFITTRCVAYGPTGQGTIIPKRPEPRFNENGALRVHRLGTTTATLNAWYAYRAASGSTMPQASQWNSFYSLLTTEASALTSAGAPITGRTDWVAYLAAAAAVDALYAANQVVTTADPNYIILKDDQWEFLEQEAMPATNYAALLADLTAQAAILFNRSDLIPLSRDLLQTSIWQLDNGATATAYADITSSPYSVGYRLAQYPNSEDKIRGAQEDTMFAVLLNELLTPNPRPFIPIMTF